MAMDLKPYLGELPAEARTGLESSLSRVNQLSARATAYSGTLQTTDGSAATLLTFVPSDESTTLVEATIIGVVSDGSASGGYKVMATVNRNGGTTALAGSATVVHSGEGTAAFAGTIDVSSPSVRIRVTGDAATTVNWYAHVVATTIAN